MGLKEKGLFSGQQYKSLGRISGDDTSKHCLLTEKCHGIFKDLTSDVQKMTFKLTEGLKRPIFSDFYNAVIFNNLQNDGLKMSGDNGQKTGAFRQKTACFYDGNNVPRLS